MAETEEEWSEQYGGDYESSSSTSSKNETPETLRLLGAEMFPPEAFFRTDSLDSVFGITSEEVVFGKPLGAHVVALPNLTIGAAKELHGKDLLASIHFSPELQVSPEKNIVEASFEHPRFLVRPEDLIAYFQNVPSLEFSSGTSFPIIGYDLHLHKPVFVKISNLELSTNTFKLPVSLDFPYSATAYNTDAFIAESFSKEARALARIHFPAGCARSATVYDFGVFPAHTPNERSLFIVEELVQGRKIDEYLNSLPFEKGSLEWWQVAFPIFEKLGASLDYLKAEKYAQRDVKPGNIIIEDGTGEVVLIDFGNFFGSLHGNDSCYSKHFVTPHFAPPSENSLTVLKTDVYSLAATIHSILIDAPPTANTYTKEASLLIRSASVSPRIYAVLARGAALESDRRYKSCASMLSSLRKAISD